MKAEQYETWEQAFDACREANHPITVTVAEDTDDRVGKIFPSGYVQQVGVKTQEPTQ